MLVNCRFLSMTHDNSSYYVTFPSNITHSLVFKTYSEIVLYIITYNSKLAEFLIKNHKYYDC